MFLPRTIDVPERIRTAQLKDLKVIATIGVGGFGRVELVCYVVHIFSARCNTYISRLCYDVSVRLSVRLSVCL